MAQKLDEESVQRLAERAQAAVETGSSDAANRVVIAVIGRDRTGILAGVTGIMARRAANILDVSQTTMSDLFVMIMLVDIERINVTFADLKQELEEHGRREALSIIIQHEEIFRAMHRI